MCGARSRNRRSIRVVHKSAGSTTWESAEIKLSIGIFRLPGNEFLFRTSPARCAGRIYYTGRGAASAAGTSRDFHFTLGLQLAFQTKRPSLDNVLVWFCSAVLPAVPEGRGKRIQLEFPCAMNLRAQTPGNRELGGPCRGHAKTRLRARHRGSLLANHAGQERGTE